MNHTSGYKKQLADQGSALTPRGAGHIEPKKVASSSEYTIRSKAQESIMR